MPDYLIDASKNTSVDTITQHVFNKVCRRDFSAPGFALIRLPTDFNSSAQRRLMVDLKELRSASKKMH